MMSTFTDQRDGETYKIVKINNQTWLAENLRYKGPVKKFNDWTIEEKSFYYPPNGDRNNIKEYGCLYAWNNAFKACPDGWHLPTKEEFEELLKYSRSDNSSQSQNLRAANWSSSADKCDRRAFRTLYKLPSGYSACVRYYFFGSCAYFWSSTELNTYCAYRLCLIDNDVDLCGTGKDCAYSVRCVRN